MADHTEPAGVAGGEHHPIADRPRHATHGGSVGVLTLGALGVVFGDIGTNPLFAMREAFESSGIAVDEANVLGLLSLMFWSLLIVISVKYIGFVMRADNEGEGGILALTSLVKGTDTATKGRRWLLLLLGLFGTALLYGDGVITPAISVLAAVEGTTVAAPDLQGWVRPAAVVIIIGLFLVQRKGTASIGRVFGPVMVVWFATLVVLGGNQVVRHPGVLQAVNPVHAASFFASNGVVGFLVLGSVVLVVVGGEALYADMGHFGRRPIVLSWYGLVLPALLLVYFGQGAMLIAEPDTIDNPFFRLAPSWALYPLVVLATAATVIASQALISGAFSITRQAVQLGYSPRVKVTHTSETEIGQIYVGAINWFLMAACIGLVLGFQNSTNLAGAYGVAVTTTMVITTIIFFVVARERFGWTLARAGLLCSAFLVVDAEFFGATLFKIPHGGWFPLVLGAGIFTLLTTWRTGRRLVRGRVMAHPLELDRFTASLAEHPQARAPGAGAYLFSEPGMTPPSLLGNLRHNDSLHEQVLIISIVTEKVPRVHRLRRADHVDLGHGFHQVTLHYGFMEAPDVPAALAARVVMHTGTDLDTLTYFLGREALRVTARPGMARWREGLFAFLSRNATSAANYFHLPADQTVELGLTVEL